MQTAPIAEGEGIFRLIPQRPPIVMVDALFSVSESGAETGLFISSDNIFVSGGCLMEPGIIEHVAQSAAAFAGYSQYLSGEEPKLGYIAEIKKFSIGKLPLAGQHLRTRLEVLGQAGNMSLLSAVVSAGEEEIAGGQMKIFIKE